jgi:biotin carboxyl carrier protein
MSRYSIAVNGVSYSVELRGRRGTLLTFAVDGVEYAVEVSSTTHASKAPLPSRGSSSAERGSTPEVRAPIPGIVSEVRVAVGDAVSKDSTLVVIEAMKMENPIKAQRTGTVSKVHVTKGQEVLSGHLLVEIAE